MTTALVTIDAVVVHLAAAMLCTPMRRTRVRSLIMEDVVEDMVEDAVVAVVTAGDVMVGVAIGISYLDATSPRIAMKGT